ncbi:terminase gpP N-terminus-related DNA-binding protein, partial [Salmonella enterica]|uniref:terminase gpP N-terminus-related DNA-binding protein n=1 Tax=Salmonella enterica TaxID=28901 RepID=UPI00398C56C2
MSRAQLEKTYWGLMVAVMGAVKQCAVFVPTTPQTAGGESLDSSLYVCAMNTTLTPADLDPRRQAMLLYFQRYLVARIAEMLGEKVATVHSWKKRYKWANY